MQLVEPYSSELFKKIEKYNTDANFYNCQLVDVDIVKKALKAATYYHNGQFRKSGEPYVIHPIAVASIAMKQKFTNEIICGALLHDVIEDSECTIGTILDNFGWRIAEIVYALTRQCSNNRKMEPYEILINCYNKSDDDVILIKLSDRLHNLQTISSLAKEKILKNKQETIKYFLQASIYIENHNIEEQIYLLCMDIINNYDLDRDDFSQNIYLHQNSLNFLSQIFQKSALHEQKLA